MQPDEQTYDRHCGEHIEGGGHRAHGLPLIGSPAHGDDLTALAFDESHDDFLLFLNEAHNLPNGDCSGELYHLYSVCQYYE